MKSNPRDLMRDPFFANLIFVIELRITKADSAAKAVGIRMTDSQALSALTKAKGLAAGKAPKIEESTEAERAVGGFDTEHCRGSEGDF